MLLRLKQKELLHDKYPGGIAVCACSDFARDKIAVNDRGGKQTETFKKKNLLSHVLHKQKVKIIQRQIRKGKYRLEDKLDTAMDRIIEEICETK